MWKICNLSLQSQIKREPPRCVGSVNSCLARAHALGRLCASHCISWLHHSYIHEMLLGVFVTYAWHSHSVLDKHFSHISDLRLSVEVSVKSFDRRFAISTSLRNLKLVLSVRTCWSPAWAAPAGRREEHASADAPRCGWSSPYWCCWGRGPAWFPARPRLEPKRDWTRLPLHPPRRPSLPPHTPRLVQSGSAALEAKISHLESNVMP